ncbi:MAG: FG-GAP-like repeat-containing protein, partial [bacterium]
MKSNKGIVEKYLKLFIFFVFLAKAGEGKMPVFSSYSSTATSNVLQLGKEGVDWFPSPVLYDWNNDGKKDLLVGDKDGYIRFYANNYVPSASVYPTKVKVTPSVTYSSGIGSWFNIDVDIENVEDLAILNLTLFFDPKKVNISPSGTPTKGGFLGGGNWGSELVIDREQGKLEIRNFILPSLTSGTGTLVDNIRFEVLEDSPNSLVLQGILYGSNHAIYEIPCELKGGEVYPQGYIPADPFVPQFQFSTYTLLEYASGTDMITIDVGENAKPYFTDYNRDGIIDLLVGCASGEVYLVLGTNVSPYLLCPEKLTAGTMFVTKFGNLGVVDNVFVSGGYAYVTQGLAGLSIYDIKSNINNPSLFGGKPYDPDKGVVNNVYVEGEYAYIANGAEGLLILNISDPSKPTVVANYKGNNTGICRGIIVVDEWAYIANGNKGLWVVNTQDAIKSYAGAPVTVRQGLYTHEPITQGNCSNVLYLDGYIILGVGAAGIHCVSVDVSRLDDSGPNPDAFIYKWNVKPQGIGACDMSGIAVFKDRYLFIASGIPGIVCYEKSGADWGNTVIYKPILKDTSYANDIVLSRVGDYAFVADGASGMRVLKINNPNEPWNNLEEEVGYDTPGEAVSISLYGDYALIADKEEGVCVVNVSAYYVQDKDLDVGANSSPCFSDFDEDGARDLLVGDELGRIWFYKNLGCDDEPSFSKDGEKIVVGTDTLDVGENASPYFIDWDGDGIKDFIAGDNFGYIWFFKQEPATGTTRSFRKGEKIKVSGMDIDVGFRASPFVSDIDGNGGYDLVVGEAGGSIDVFLNTKKTFAEPPNFNFSYKMPGPSSDINQGIDPSVFVCDFDGDKRNDLIIGTNKGEVYLYRNLGEVIPMFNGGFALYTTSGTITSILDVEYNATPFIYDLDGDGNKDLISGNSEGYVLFYKNIGSDDAPLFSLPIYLTASGIPIDVGFNSAPSLFDWDDDGKIDLLIGNSEGEVWFSKGIGTLSFNSGIPISLPSGNLKVGRDARPFVLDINKDRLFDILVGSKDGGFLFLNNGVMGSPSLTEGIMMFNEGISFAYSDFTGDMKEDIILSTKGGYILIFNNTGNVDLYLDISCDRNKIWINDLATYTLTISNKGNISANNIVIKTKIPYGVSYISGGSFNPEINEISFSTSTLSPLATETFTFSLRLEDKYQGDFFTTNASCESKEEIIPIFSNYLSLPVFRHPALKGTITPNKVISKPGEMLTYTITYNVLEKYGEDIVIEYAVPGSCSYVFQSANGGGASIEYYYNNGWWSIDSPDTTRIRWIIPYLAKDEIGSASFSIKLNEGILDKSVIENIATITAKDLGTKTLLSVIYVETKPQLTITKTGEDEINPGATLTYTLSFTSLYADSNKITIIDT